MSLTPGGKHGSVSLLYIGLGLLIVLLSYVFVQAVHRPSPTPQQEAPLHGSK